MVGVLMSAVTVFTAGFSAAWILQAARTSAKISSLEVRASEAWGGESGRNGIAEAIAERVPQSEVLASTHDMLQAGELLPLPNERPIDGPLI